MMEARFSPPDAGSRVPMKGPVQWTSPSLILFQRTFTFRDRPGWGAAGSSVRGLGLDKDPSLQLATTGQGKKSISGENIVGENMEGRHKRPWS